MKLGEMLVKAGKITSLELEETLKGQAIFGGRFGTNLVEMGFLNEHELTQFLSQKTGVPFAQTEQLMNIPPQVIRLLPEDTVRKFRVVPIALNNRKLSLAMTDPSDYAAIDEISFVTGFIVVPLITPELRLIFALEKYYNIKRDQRYISVVGGGRNRGRASQAPAPPVKKAAPSAPTPSEPEEIFELPPLDEFDCFGDMDEMQHQGLAPGSLAGVGTQREAERQGSLAGLGAQRDAVKNLIPANADPQREALENFFPAGAGTPPEAEKDFSLDGVLRGLAQVNDRQDVAELIVGYTARQFNKAALFLIKADQATGWLAQIGAKPLPGFDALSIGMNEPSVLRMVADSKTHYLGPMPISPCNSRISAALGGSPPKQQLLAPLLMMGRVVAVLYVDGGNGQLDESIPELLKLLAKGTMAFEILILKNKILLT
jgi:hypothetical protein